MRRALPPLLAVLLALPLLAADPRAEKRALIDELLQVLDAKAMIRGSFDQLTAPGKYPDDASEEERAFRERLYVHLDYAKFAEEVYVPLFDKNFSADELRALIAFARTKPGQKLIAVLPELGIGAAMQGSDVLTDAIRKLEEESRKEEETQHPWKRTMADMRTVAVAVEARATDTNEYPKVDFDELPAVIEPTYIRKTPRVDAWGTPFFFISDGQRYRIVSAGADRHFEWNARQLEDGETKVSDDLDADIIFQDGTFLQYPKEAAPQQ